jgi:hypothetical protein
MKLVFKDMKRRINLKRFGKRLLIIGFAFGLMAIFQHGALAQSTILTCPTPLPTPAPAVTEINIPYTISYGFRATDRSYGSPDGISTQKGTLSFSVKLFEKQVKLKLANQNFVVGKDSSGERAVNFGNTSASISYIPAKLQESTKWSDTHFYPSWSFTYEATIPTGSRSRGLNVGRVDHDIVVALDKKVGKKLAITDGSGNIKADFARRTSVGAELGVSFAANEGGGFNKTGNFLVNLNRTLGDINTGKYTYYSEVSLGNLATKARTSIRTFNSLDIMFDKSSTLLSLGLIAGVSRGTPRVGINISVSFFGAFKITK